MLLGLWSHEITEKGSDNPCLVSDVGTNYLNSQTVMYSIIYKVLV